MGIRGRQHRYRIHIGVQQFIHVHIIRNNRTTLFLCRPGSFCPGRSIVSARIVCSNASDACSLELYEDLDLKRKLASNQNCTNESSTSLWLGLDFASLPCSRTGPNLLEQAHPLTGHCWAFNRLMLFLVARNPCMRLYNLRGPIHPRSLLSALRRSHYNCSEPETHLLPPQSD